MSMTTGTRPPRPIDLPAMVKALRSPGRLLSRRSQVFLKRKLLATLETKMCRSQRTTKNLPDEPVRLRRNPSLLGRSHNKWTKGSVHVTQENGEKPIDARAVNFGVGVENPTFGGLKTTRWERFTCPLMSREAKPRFSWSKGDGKASTGSIDLYGDVTGAALTLLLL